MFEKQFRMTKDCFHVLARRIEDAVGSSEFKSDSYLRSGVNDKGIKSNNRIKIIHEANKKATGGFISGEVKLAITLRILSGGSYLDIADIFHVFPTHCHHIYHRVMEDWICNDAVIKINIFDYLNDDNQMKKTSDQFASGPSGGIMGGCIGCLDGWLVKILFPSITRDNVINPGHYYSRKGYYALNVQVIVDKEKMILWKSINGRGAAHDSLTFKDTKLYETMLECKYEFLQKKRYFVGDSAYGLRSFLLVPYDNAKPGSSEDAFNFYLSSIRIYVECTFGEIDMCWGIFRKGLCFDMKHMRATIDVPLVRSIQLKIQMNILLLVRNTWILFL